MNERIYLTSGSITLAIDNTTLLAVFPSVEFFFSVLAGTTFFGVALALDFMSSF